MRFRCGGDQQIQIIYQHSLPSQIGPTCPKMLAAS
jgi:hypothetical protein